MIPVLIEYQAYKSVEHGDSFRIKNKMISVSGCVLLKNKKIPTPASQEGESGKTRCLGSGFLIF